MLFEFLTQNREEILKRARKKAAERIAPVATDNEIHKGIGLFFAEMVRNLRLAEDKVLTVSIVDSNAAAKIGAELLKQGFTVSHVVHGYGDICQSITELAVELNEPITPEEFRVFNLMLDMAIAEAVAGYSLLRSEELTQKHMEHLGSLVHELRNSLVTARLAFEQIEQGMAKVHGQTAAILDRSLTRMSKLIDRSISDVRMRLDKPIAYISSVSLLTIIDSVEIDASLDARAKGVRMHMCTPPQVNILCDPQLYISALMNVINNAIKYTHKGGEIWVRIKETSTALFIEVEDQCGGLTIDEKDLFLSFVRGTSKEEGLGLGLTVAKKAIEAMGGTISFKNLPEKGCIFVLGIQRESKKEV